MFAFRKCIENDLLKRIAMDKDTINWEEISIQFIFDESLDLTRASKSLLWEVILKSVSHRVSDDRRTYRDGHTR